ncbi:hypothetical protein Btru_003474 [Bulinus truncatus]|nr:hypothetical protein Btru_003474 [Bulinus truncatus]
MSLVQKVDCRHDLISTTESDWTSVSQEQEMLCDMIERKKQCKQYQKPFHHLYNTCRHERPPELSLDFTSSIERVKSWISSSTPDEEMPPNLTLTLNLDSVHQNIELGPISNSDSVHTDTVINKATVSTFISWNTAVRFRTRYIAFVPFLDLT